ncbi:phage integrase SAM-like domain-containing protein [Winogradskyella maritima]|nr:phage integrase SAM-like domain-containing protein [Winogradskyella maritima]
MELQSEKKDITANQIKSKLYSSSKSTSFFEVADEFLNEQETNKKLARHSADKARVNHVLSFVKSRQLTFQEIDEQFLRKFRSYLMATRKISERSIVNNLVVIRTIYNRAIKMGIVDKKLYPFGSDKIRIKFLKLRK